MRLDGVVVHVSTALADGDTQELEGITVSKVGVPWSDTPPGVVCYNDLEAKPLDVIALADTGVDAAKRVTTLNVSPPAERSAGIMVGSVEELVEKLKNEAKVI